MFVDKIYKNIFIVSVIFLAIVCGYLIREFKLFPYSHIHYIKEYIVGRNELQADTLVKRLKNDLGISPERNLVLHTQNPQRNYKEITLKNKNPRRDNPLVYTSGNKRGYYAVLAALDLENSIHGAILIDAETGNIVHQWPLHIPEETNPSLPVHGFAVLQDGSIIFNGDGIGILNKVGMCGDLIWQKKLPTHHAIGLSPDEKTLWTFYAQELIKIDTRNGEILQHITFNNIFENNPDIDIFGIRQEDEIKRQFQSPPIGAMNQNWANDPIHHNDIEPFPEKYTDAYGGQFNKYDLLVSSRSLNLIYVINSKSGKIKWWNFGNTRRQHDPDWLPNGKIRVYDNNMHRYISRIIDITPSTNKVEIKYQDKQEEFYSEIRGKSHTYNENLVITIPQQGRFIDIDSNGNVQFEFLNRYEENNDEMRNLIIMSAIHLPQDFYARNKNKCKS